jgi:hypothetical protein
MEEKDWRDIFCCSYCKNYIVEKAFCSEKNKELNIQEELMGCNDLKYNGKKLEFSFFINLPSDSYLRKLKIKDLEEHNPIRTTINSWKYSQYFSEKYSLEKNNETSSKIFNKKGKIIKLDRGIVDEKLKKRKIIDSIINNTKSF